MTIHSYALYVCRWNLIFSWYSHDILMIWLSIYAIVYCRLDTTHLPRDDIDHHRVHVYFTNSTSLFISPYHDTLLLSAGWQFRLGPSKVTSCDFKWVSVVCAGLLLGIGVSLHEADIQCFWLLTIGRIMVACIDVSWLVLYCFVYLRVTCMNCYWIELNHIELFEQVAGRSMGIHKWVLIVRVTIYWL